MKMPASHFLFHQRRQMKPFDEREAAGIKFPESWLPNSQVVATCVNRCGLVTVRWFVQTVWCYEMSRVSPIMRILTLLFGVKLSGDKVKTAFYGSLQMWLWASDMSHMLWRRLVKNGRAWQTYSLGMFLWWAQTVSQFGTLPFMASNK